MKRVILGLLCVLAFGCNHDESTPPADHHAANTQQPATADTAERTNTVVNGRDTSSTAVTPMNQSENPGDINITAEIHKQVVAAKMSVDADNVKITTQNGKVTLRGPVSAAEEKQKIEAIAANVAGAGNVDDQLEVSVKKSEVNKK